MNTERKQGQYDIFSKSPEPEVLVVFEDDEGEEVEGFIGRGPFGKLAEIIILTAYMLADYARGHYRRVPFWAITAIMLTLLYVGSPVDLLPDFRIGMGQIDDVIVIGLCLFMIRQEIYEYRSWKIAQQWEDEEQTWDF